MDSLVGNHSPSLENPILVNLTPNYPMMIFRMAILSVAPIRIVFCLQFCRRCVRYSALLRWCCISILTVTLLGKTWAIDPVDPDATPATRDLLNYLHGLKSQPGKRVLSGQTLDNLPSNYEEMITDLEAETGHYVGILQTWPYYFWNSRGSETGSVTRDHHSPSFYYPLFYNHAKRGGLCMLLYNPNNPWLGTTDRVGGVPAGHHISELWTPGNDAYDRWHEGLDMLAVGLRKLQEDDIPVMIRMFGECNLGMGYYRPRSRNLTWEEFKTLWNHVVDYMRLEQDVHNVLWCFEVSDNAGDRMDGYQDDKVDIAGIQKTFYGNDTEGSFRLYPEYLENSTKPILYGQYLVDDSLAGQYDYSAAIERIRNSTPEVVGVLPWRDINTPKWSLIYNQNTQEFLDDPWVANRSDTPFAMDPAPAEIPFEYTISGNEPGDFAYNFNSNGNSQGWSEGGSLQNALVRDKRWNVFYLGANPSVVGPAGMNLDATELSRFKIRLRNNCLTSEIKLQWKRVGDAGFDSSREVSVTVNPCDLHFTTYYTDLDGVAEWDGTIEQVRLLMAPDNVWGSSEIDYIQFKEPGNERPSCEITYPAKDAEFLDPADITVKVNASDLDGSVAKVELRLDGLTVGEFTTPPYHFELSGVGEGSHQILALAFDDDNSTSNSTINILVKDATPGAPDINVTIEAETYSDQQGLGTYNGGTGRKIGSIENGTWARYSAFNFATGPTHFEISLASANLGGVVEFRLDFVSGLQFGSASIGGTGSWNNFQTVSGSLTSTPTGIHDLYLVFSGGDGALLDVDWFQLTTPVEDAPVQFMRLLQE